MKLKRKEKIKSYDQLQTVIKTMVQDSFELEKSPDADKLLNDMCNESFENVDLEGLELIVALEKRFNIVLSETLDNWDYWIPGATIKQLTDIVAKKMNISIPSDTGYNPHVKKQNLFTNIANKLKREKIYS